MFLMQSVRIISYQTTTGNYNLNVHYMTSKHYYIIPNNNWELQQLLNVKIAKAIISYQTTTGNYNHLYSFCIPVLIISYQTTTGNYNESILQSWHLILYHTKQQLGTTTIFTRYLISFYYIIPNNNWELQLETVSK